MIALSFTASLALSISLGVALSPQAAQPQADSARTAERDSFRALALLASGEPPIEEVQRAAAAVAGVSGGEAGEAARRARYSALLPRLTVQYARDERIYRVVGLQGSGEVDYQRISPGVQFGVKATWELSELVSPKGEIAASQAESERARRRIEAVKRATVLYYERRRARLDLLISPPESALERARAELEVDRLGAELDALTGGLLSGRRR